MLLKDILLIRRVVADSNLKGNAMKKVLAILVVSARLFAADPAVSDGMSNGKAWNGLGGGDQKMALMLKVLYVVGLADGLQQGKDEFVANLSSSPPTTEQKKTLTEAFSLVPAGKGVADVIGMLDAFYSDPQNLDIPIPVAARYQRELVFGGGRNPKELAASLSRLRILYKVSKELDSLQGK